MHLLSLHEHGSNNPLGVSANTDRLPFAPYFIFKDLVTIFLFLLGLAAVVFFVPNILGHSDNYIPANPMQTPASIVPEWYLLPFYTILRAIPDKFLGVTAMIMALVILFAIPILDTGKLRGGEHRPIFQFAFFSLFGVFVILGFIGAQHVEIPYTIIGAFATGYYFAYFLVVVPTVGVIENTLMDIALSKGNLQPESSKTKDIVHNKPEVLQAGFPFVAMILCIMACISTIDILFEMEVRDIPIVYRGLLMCSCFVFSAIHAINKDKKGVPQVLRLRGRVF